MLYFIIKILLDICPLASLLMAFSPYKSTFQEVRPQCRLEEKSVPCSSSSLLSNCSVKVTRSGFICKHNDKVVLGKIMPSRRGWWIFFRCELVSTNVTRLRPKTSCSRDQVVKSSFWKLQSCQMWSLSSSKVEVCGPGACPLVKGQTQCRREKKAVIQQVAHHHHHDHRALVAIIPDD